MQGFLQFINESHRNDTLHLVKKYSGQDVYFHFTDIDKVGIHVNTQHVSTPIGVYAHSLNYVKGEFNGSLGWFRKGKAINLWSEFMQHKPYVFVLKKTTKHGLILGKHSFNEINNVIEKFIKSEDDYLTRTAKYWHGLKFGRYLGGDAPKPEPYKAGELFWEYIGALTASGFRNTNFSNNSNILLRRMGLDWVFDNGYDIVFDEGGADQIIFLHGRAYQVIDSGVNKAKSSTMVSICDDNEDLINSILDNVDQEIQKQLPAKSYDQLEVKRQSGDIKPGTGFHVVTNDGNIYYLTVTPGKVYKLGKMSVV